MTTAASSEFFEMLENAVPLWDLSHTWSAQQTTKLKDAGYAVTSQFSRVQEVDTLSGRFARLVQQVKIDDPATGGAIRVEIALVLEPTKNLDSLKMSGDINIMGEGNDALKALLSQRLAAVTIPRPEGSLTDWLTKAVEDLRKNLLVDTSSVSATNNQLLADISDTLAF